ncbi:MAG: hypothetical protein ACON35_02295 [Candidatus Marinamargulisbacteria bacterium]
MEPINIDIVALQRGVLLKSSQNFIAHAINDEHQFKGKQALLRMFVDGISKYIITNKEKDPINYYTVHFERSKITYMAQVSHQRLHYVYYVTYDEVRQNNIVEPNKKKFWNLVNAAIKDQQQQLADIYEVRGEEPDG